MSQMSGLEARLVESGWWKRWKFASQAKSPSVSSGSFGKEGLWVHICFQSICHPPPAPKFIESTTRVERNAESAPAKNRGEHEERDMFSKSDMWLPAAPQPDFLSLQRLDKTATTTQLNVGKSGARREVRKRQGWR